MSETQEHTEPACAVTVAPAKLPAGVEASVLVSVSVTPPRDLAGRTLVLKLETGEVILAAELGEASEGTNATAATPLLSPAETGEHRWLAVLRAEDEDAADEVLGFATVSVEAHRTAVLVWDVPPTVTKGEPFRFKVGLKCLSGCRYEDWAVAIGDESGARVAIAKPGGEPWPGTTAMCWSEVEVAAQADQGHHRWTARFDPPGNAPGDAPEDAPGAGLPHEAAAVEFGVHVVPPAEYRLRVEAYDRHAQAPVPRAKVVMHPYRAFTDETGAADMRVAGGEYRIFISGSKFIPFKDLIRVEQDVTIRVELEEDIGMSVEDVWA